MSSPMKGGGYRGYRIKSQEKVTGKYPAMKCTCGSDAVKSPNHSDWCDRMTGKDSSQQTTGSVKDVDTTEPLGIDLLGDDEWKKLIKLSGYKPPKGFDDDTY